MIKNIKFVGGIVTKEDIIEACDTDEAIMILRWEDMENPDNPDDSEIVGHELHPDGKLKKIIYQNKHLKYKLEPALKEPFDIVEHFGLDGIEHYLKTTDHNDLELIWFDKDNLDASWIVSRTI